MCQGEPHTHTHATNEEEKERDATLARFCLHSPYFLLAHSFGRLLLQKLCTWKVTASSLQSTYSCSCFARADCNTLTVCFCVRSSYKLRWCFKPRSVCMCVCVRVFFFHRQYFPGFISFVCLFSFFFVFFCQCFLPLNCWWAF